MALVLDAGALEAFERSNLTVPAMEHRTQVRWIPVCTSPGVTAHVRSDRSTQVISTDVGDLVHLARATGKRISIVPLKA